MVNIKNFIKTVYKQKSSTYSKAGAAQHSKDAVRSGFSLAEILVAMLVMSIFFMATTKVITIKQKPALEESPHGYYECTDSPGSTDMNFHEHRVDSSRETIPANSSDVDFCTFVPPKNIPLFNVYVYSSTKGFLSTSEAQISEDSADFRGANVLLDYYLSDDPSLAQTINGADLNNRIAQFKLFLRTSYPQSMLSKSWTGTRPPRNTVFITW